MDSIKLKILKSEIELLRSQVPDLVHRCDCIYSIHRYATDKTPTTNGIVRTNMRKLAFRAARKTLERLLTVKTGAYCPKAYAATVELVNGLENRGYDILPTHPEYDRLKMLIDTPIQLDAKRIKAVQNLDGIYFSNLHEFENELMANTLKLEELERSEFLDEKEIKNTKYHIHAITQVLDGDVKVHNYRQFNECRLYSTLTNLPKKLRKNLYTEHGTFYELDIKASQPRLTKKVLMKMLDDFTIHDYLYKVLKLPEIKNIVITESTIKEFSNWKHLVSDDLIRFNELTKNDFYLEVSTDPMFRDTMKKQFMLYFFDYRKKVESGYYFHKYMVDNFKYIDQFVKSCHLCRSYYSFRSNLYDIPANFSKMEASIILETICKKFIQANPNSSIFTVHDGINVNLKDLRQIIDLTSQAYSDADVYLSYKVTCLGTGESLSAQPTISGTLDYIQNIQTLETIENVKTLENRERENRENIIIISKVPDIVGCADKPRRRSRKSSITTTRDGRFKTSIKNKNYNSRKNETLEDFERRIDTIKRRMQ